MPDHANGSMSSAAAPAPDWASQVRARLSSSLRLSPEREREIVDELSQHLDDRWRELVSGGVAPDRAEAQALEEFRDHDTLARLLGLLKQAHVPSPLTPGAPAAGRWLDAGRRDFWFALRVLRRQPGFVLATLVTLALGVGATTAMFSIISATALRPLPYPQGDELVQVARSYGDDLSNSVSQVKFLHWRGAADPVFTELAAYSNLGTAFTLVGSGHPERLTGSLVTAGFFDVMGIPPMLGRGFREDEDRPGQPRVVVLGHALWRVRFGADAGIVGRSISLNGEPYLVVGVAPEGFRFPESARLWTLSRFDPHSQDRAHNFEVVGRLKPNATLEQAQAAMTLASASLRQSGPGEVGEHESVRVRPLRERLYGDTRAALWILLAAASFVLLIGCVNIANLQVTQAVGRRSEIALRLVLGASVGTLMRQLVVESVLLAIAGGAAGVVAAYFALPILLALSPAAIPLHDEIGIDWRALCVALTISLTAGLVFGLVPALQAMRLDLDRVLRAGTQRTVGNTGQWTRRVLVGSQVALALVLTIGSFLLVKSLIGLQSTSLGTRVEHVLTMKLGLPEAKYGSGDALAQLQEQLQDRLSAVPGVRASGFAVSLPLERGADLPFTIEGRYMPGTETGVGYAEYRPVGPGYFDTLAIPLQRGRRFEARDRRGAPAVAVVNETAARRFWPNEDPIGQRITVGQPSLPDVADVAPREIVGVVADVREMGLDVPVPSIVYAPLSQLPDGFAKVGTRLLPFSVVVHGDIGTDNLARSVQEAIWTVDPDQPIDDIRQMRDIVARSLGSQRFNTVLLGGFAALALVLAAVGLYGTIAHLVGQQTREIGVRMALGATQTAVVGHFMRQATALLLVGIVVGLIGAAAVTRVLHTLLTGVGTNDPWVFVLAPLALLTVGVAAAAVPAFRAGRVDPMQALRS